MAGYLSGETLRILLVGGDEAGHNTVVNALTERMGNHRLFWASQPELAAVRTQDLLPHVILIDNSLGGSASTQLIRELVAQTPNTALIALVGADQMSLARASMLAGARAFVTKPITAIELTETLRQVLGQSNDETITRRDQPAAQQTGRILAWCAPKGGTGRTTLAINSAIALHHRTRQPLVMVDADFAAPALDVALNVHSEADMLDVLPRLAQFDQDLMTSVLATHSSGIRVLLAPPPGDLLEPIPIPQIQQLMSQLKRTFAWTVVDTGLPQDESMFTFLDAADRIVLNVLPEMVGLRNTRIMLDLMRERSYSDEKIWVVLNRATINGGISRSAIENRLKIQVRHTVPDDQGLVTHSVNRGVPLMLSHPRSAVGRSITELARQLTADLERSSPNSNGLPNRHGRQSNPYNNDQRQGPLRRLFGGMFRGNKPDPFDGSK